MRRVFIDTSGFAAIYNRQDNLHDRAKEIWQSLFVERPPMFTSNYVVAETITLLRARSGFHNAVQFGEALFSSAILRIVRVTESHEANGWTIFKKFEDQDISFTDCVSFAIMQEVHIPQAFSFDRHFALLGFELL